MSSPCRGECVGNRVVPPRRALRSAAIIRLAQGCSTPGARQDGPSGTETRVAGQHLQAPVAQPRWRSLVEADDADGEIDQAPCPADQRLSLHTRDDRDAVLDVSLARHQFTESLLGARGVRSLPQRSP